MAEKTDEPKPGCSAWLEVIRGTLHERLTKARNSIHRRRSRDKKNAQPSTPNRRLPGAGSGDIGVARKQVLLPRPAVIDLNEDITSLRAMIASLDSKECSITHDDASEKDGVRETILDIDVDKLVDDLLRKVSEEFQSCPTHSPRTPSFTSLVGSASATSSQISNFAETVVDESLTRIVSPPDLHVDIDMHFPYNYDESKVCPKVIYEDIFA